MTIVNGHFDGQRVVLDEPVPSGVSANTPVKVVFDSEGADDVLAEIARLGRPGGLPPDFAEQHEHYVKGTPRR
ncbi:MAG TPA: hypothetical protein PLL20_07160 [Phycisphaerae bacterium]|nr:hypothetical protein [Phycisphaerae bacterium]HRR87562.1 hypothetical protein [Phycisphaerae bacterium]